MFAAYAFSRLCYLMIQHSDENIKFSIFLLETLYSTLCGNQMRFISHTFPFLVDLFLYFVEFDRKLLELIIQRPPGAQA